MLQKKTFLLLPILFLFSCATARWKKEYVDRHLYQYNNDFGISHDSTMHLQLTGKEGLTLKPFEKLTRRDVRHNVKIFQNVYAIIPDSVSNSAIGLDSFYFNQNKIKVIINNKLRTSNMYFVGN